MDDETKTFETLESDPTIELVPIKDVEHWDYSNPKQLTCINHQTARYHWKGPGRNMYVLKLPDQMEYECSCPTTDLRVMRRAVTA